MSYIDKMSRKASETNRSWFCDKGPWCGKEANPH